MTLRWKIAAAWIALTVIFFAGWAAREASRFLPGAGASVLVKVAPVDPRDLLSGQFINLSYEFSRVNRDLVKGEMPAEGDAVWIVLAPKDRFHVPREMSRNRPSGVASNEVVIRGRVTGRDRVDCGVERCYVPEKTPTPDPRDITVLLRVGGDHRARIERVFVKDQPWP